MSHARFSCFETVINIFKSVLCRTIIKKSSTTKKKSAERLRTEQLLEEFKSTVKKLLKIAKVNANLN